MSSSAAIIAKRYAKALWLHAEGNNETIRAWIAPLTSLAKSIRDSRELTELVRSPSFTTEERWNVLSQVAKTLGANDHLVRFLNNVVASGRAPALPAIAEELKQHLLAQENSVEATVETAIALNDASTKQIASVVEKMVGKKVLLTTVLNPELLAGIRIHVMGKTLDASLVSSLDLMNKQLLKADATPKAKMAQA
jgi:F-type H+-transporting ATPase subunit delta